MAIFTPLSKSAVNTKKWELTGFGVWDDKGFLDTKNFSNKLSVTDHNRGLINKVNLLENSKDWLLDHYGYEKTEETEEIEQQKGS